MMEFTPTQAREIIERIRKKSEYTRENGAKCWVCGQMNRIKTARRGIRYHQCSRCGHKYQS